MLVGPFLGNLAFRNKRDAQCMNNLGCDDQCMNNLSCYTNCLNACEPGQNEVADC